MGEGDSRLSFALGRDEPGYTTEDDDYDEANEQAPAGRELLLARRPGTEDTHKPEDIPVRHGCEGCTAWYR
jgi:hypothetical protein